MRIQQGDTYKPFDQWPVKNPARLTHESGRISEWDDGLEESHKIWIVIVVKGKGANQEWMKSWPGICESSTTGDVTIGDVTN